MTQPIWDEEIKIDVTNDVAFTAQALDAFVFNYIGMLEKNSGKEVADFAHLRFVEEDAPHANNEGKLYFVVIGVKYVEPLEVEMVQEGERPQVGE